MQNAYGDEQHNYLDTVSIQINSKKKNPKQQQAKQNQQKPKPKQTHRQTSAHTFERWLLEVSENNKQGDLNQHNQSKEHTSLKTEF